MASRRRLWTDAMSRRILVKFRGRRMWINALDNASLPASSKMTGYTPLVLRGVTEDGGDL